MTQTLGTTGPQDGRVLRVAGQDPRRFKVLAYLSPRLAILHRLRTHIIVPIAQRRKETPRMWPHLLRQALLGLAKAQSPPDPQSWTLPTLGQLQRVWGIVTQRKDPDFQGLPVLGDSSTFPRRRF